MADATVACCALLTVPGSAGRQAARHRHAEADRAFGGNGEDDILPAEGSDIARGGKHGDRDVIRCGRGDGIAVFDALDVARACEYAFRSVVGTPRRLPKI